MKENLRYILTLALICLVTATLLSGVYLLARPKILAQRQQAQQQALQEVLPAAGYFEPVTEDGAIVYFRAYQSADKSRLIGYAFLAQGKGYSGPIETMAGIDRQGTVAGIKILAQNETPGLGARVGEVQTKQTLWQRVKELFVSEKRPQAKAAEPQFCAQFKGKKVDDLLVVSGPTAENIQAITGATVSSWALTNSVREKAEQILEYEKKGEY